MSEELRAQAEKLRSSNVLGREGPMTRLFDFLVEQSLEGRAPKEVEIAVQVFGKQPAQDAAQDANVRVYVHRLRRKLEDYYAGDGRHDPIRLAIPRGEYRLIVESASETIVPEVNVGEPTTRRHWRLGTRGVSLVLVALLCASLLANLGLYAWRATSTRTADRYEELRNSPLWSNLFDDDEPITVVVGDYYIFGERGEDGAVQRLVREFHINSASDLRERTSTDAALESRYENLDLRYLPTSSASVLGEIMPLLQRGDKRVEITLASDFHGRILKSGHIVYVGFLSGMGKLLDVAFERSRFAIGHSFDDIIDTVDHRTYVSQAVGAAPGGRSYRDYGYLSSSTGPDGRAMVVIAGTRDLAVMHMARVLTRKIELDTLAKQAGIRGVEALYEVVGVDSADLHSELIAASPLGAP
jgi:hypothetical protein